MSSLFMSSTAQCKICFELNLAVVLSVIHGNVLFESRTKAPDDEQYDDASDLTAMEEGSGSTLQVRGLSPGSQYTLPANSWHSPSKLANCRAVAVLYGAKPKVHIQHMVYLGICQYNAFVQIGLHMGPNNLCYVTRHFLFYPYVPMSLFIRPTFYSFYKRPHRISKTFKVAMSHFIFYPYGALKIVAKHFKEAMYFC